jgi:hypothetical protein
MQDVQFFLKVKNAPTTGRWRNNFTISSMECTLHLQTKLNNTLMSLNVTTI